MAQFARPSEDISVGNWTNQANAATNLWQSIDEIVADEADFVQASLTANSDYEFRLSTQQAGLIRRGHILRYRGRKNQAAGNTRGVIVELRQGATVIASNTHADLTVVWLDGVIVLTPEQAAQITNYADLRVRLRATGVISGSGSVRRRPQISWVQFRIPEVLFGATEVLVGPPLWQYSLNGFVGEGPSKEDALVDLFTKIRDANPSDPENDRRWSFIYYARKIRDYTIIRSQIVEGTYPDAPYLTQTEKLAVIDAKLAMFDTITSEADSQDGG
jgi:hypothetical protein